MNIPYRFRHWWNENVRPLYAPQHGNLRKAVPKTWQDLTSIIPDFLYAAIIDFVEGEEGLKHWEYQDPEHPAKKNAAMLREVYEWAKTGRAAEYERISNMHPPFAPGTDILEWLNEDSPERDVAYAHVWAAEKEMEEKDSRYMQWIVSRDVIGSLWT